MTENKAKHFWIKSLYGILAKTIDKLAKIEYNNFR